MVYGDQIEQPERYYLNKRMDSIEESMRIGFLELREVIETSNSQNMELFKTCKKNCEDDIITLKTDVKSLSGYKNRAIGAIGVLLLLLSMWKIG